MRALCLHDRTIILQLFFYSAQSSLGCIKLYLILSVLGHVAMVQTPVRKDTVGVESDSLQLHVITQITQTASLQHSTPNRAAIAYECLRKIRGVALRAAKPV